MNNIIFCCHPIDGRIVVGLLNKGCAYTFFRNDLTSWHKTSYPNFGATKELTWLEEMVIKRTVHRALKYGALELRED